MSCNNSTLWYRFRGCIGVIALLGSLYTYFVYKNHLLSLVLLAGALMAFKGCLLCWITGLLTRFK